MDRTTQWAPRGSFVAPRGLKLLQAFVANPRQVASIIASSPALQGELSKLACLHTAKSVVELGPGTGETTQAILEAIPEDAVLFSIEIVPDLAETARRTLAQAGVRSVEVRTGNGYLGWPEHAPFDRIIVTAAAKEIPPILAEQLAIGGIMVIPLEEGAGKQDLFRIIRTEHGLEREKLLRVRFVPLVSGVARES